MNIALSSVHDHISSPLTTTGHRFGKIHIYTAKGNIKKIGKSIYNFADISCSVEKLKDKSIWTVICFVKNKKDDLGWEKRGYENSILIGKKMIVSYETFHTSDKILNVQESVFS